jgi:hypothetical protein
MGAAQSISGTCHYGYLAVISNCHCLSLKSINLNPLIKIY